MPASLALNGSLPTARPSPPHFPGHLTGPGPSSTHLPGPDRVVRPLRFPSVPPPQFAESVLSIVHKPFADRVNAYDHAPGFAAYGISSGQPALRELEREPTSVQDADKTIAKYLQQVAGNGDCLFLSVAAIIPQIFQVPHGQLSSTDVRAGALSMLELYPEEHERLAKLIVYMYHSQTNEGALQPGSKWYFIAPKNQASAIDTTVKRMQADMGVSRMQAAAWLFESGQHAIQSVDNIKSYIEFMKIGTISNDTMVCLVQHDSNGAVTGYGFHDSITWGDDVMTEAIATFLKSRVCISIASEGLPLTVELDPWSKNLVKTEPVCLFMDATQHEPNHYEPLLCKPALVSA
jgi:hypothetical protein